MKNTTVICCLLLSFSLTGCGAYKADPNAKHAIIAPKDYSLFRNQIVISISEDNTCSDTKNLSSLGKPVMINADKGYTTLLISHVTGGQTLFYPISFSPKNNHTYWVTTKSYGVDSKGVKSKGLEATIGNRIETTLSIYDEFNSKEELVPFVERNVQVAGFFKISCEKTDLYKAKKVTNLSRVTESTSLSQYMMTRKEN